MRLRSPSRIELYVAAVILGGVAVLAVVAPQVPGLVAEADPRLAILVVAVLVGELRPDPPRPGPGRGRALDHLHLRDPAHVRRRPPPRSRRASARSLADIIHRRAAQVRRLQRRPVHARRERRGPSAPARRRPARTARTSASCSSSPRSPPAPSSSPSTRAPSRVAISLTQRLAPPRRVRRRPDPPVGHRERPPRPRAARRPRAKQPRPAAAARAAAARGAARRHARARQPPASRCTTRSPACRTASCSPTGRAARSPPPSAASTSHRGHAHRPRPLQGHQRHARPPLRRRGPAPDVAAADRAARPARHGRPARRRRVRRSCCARPRSADAGAWPSPTRSAAALAEPFDAEGVRLELGGSVGVAILPRRRRATSRRCCSAPTSRCTRPRRARPASSATRVHRTTDSLTRLALAADLRRALEDGEFVPYFQPKVDLRAGRRRRRGAPCAGTTRRGERLARRVHPASPSRPASSCRSRCR